MEQNTMNKHETNIHKHNKQQQLKTDIEKT